MAQRRLGAKVPFFVRFLGPLSSRILLRLAPLTAPFSMEKFFHAHYSKVASQTRALLAANIKLANDLGTPHAALEELQRRLPS